MLTKDSFVFFYGAENPNGWGSNWHYSPFTASISFAGQQHTHTFPTNEHWMMARKAALFNDPDSFDKIVSVSGATKADLTYVKSLGRKVQGFDEEVWLEHREEIVYQGLLHKFRGNESIRKELFNTEDKMLVEASPRDRIWGIGFGAKNAMNRRDDWGLNLLGKALVRCRETLREEQQQQQTGTAAPTSEVVSQS